MQIDKDNKADEGLNIEEYLTEVDAPVSRPSINSREFFFPDPDEETEDYTFGQDDFPEDAGIAKVLELNDLEAYLAEKGADFSVDEAVAIADAEMKKKSQIVRESGITVKVKRGTFVLVRELLEALKKDLNA